MNERIQTLAEQAGFYVADGKIYIPSTSEEITTCQKKFAELIMRECADIAKHHVMNISTYGDAEFVDEQIREHFGVRE
jgi:hypothetical protein